MLRLTLVLIAAMFVTALIGGRDYGQVRPGLMAARQADAAPVAPKANPPAAAIASRYVAPEPGIPKAVYTPLVMPLVQAPAVVAAPEPAGLAADPVWYVNARAVNVRLGPSTETEVLGRLGRGEAASVLDISGDGWARIRIEGDGIEGYVSARFLTQTAPADN